MNKTMIWQVEAILLLENLIGDDEVARYVRSES